MADETLPDEYRIPCEEAYQAELHRCARDHYTKNLKCLPMKPKPGKRCLAKHMREHEECLAEASKAMQDCLADKRRQWDQDRRSEMDKQVEKLGKAVENGWQEAERVFKRYLPVIKSVGGLAKTFIAGWGARQLLKGKKPGAAAAVATVAVDSFTGLLETAGDAIHAVAGEGPKRSKRSRVVHGSSYPAVDHRGGQAEADVDDAFSKATIRLNSELFFASLALVYFSRAWDTANRAYERFVADAAAKPGTAAFRRAASEAATYAGIPSTPSRRSIDASPPPMQPTAIGSSCCLSCGPPTRPPRRRRSSPIRRGLSEALPGLTCCTSPRPNASSLRPRSPRTASRSRRPGLCRGSCSPPPS